MLFEDRFEFSVPTFVAKLLSSFPTFQLSVLSAPLCCMRLCDLLRWLDEDVADLPQ